MCCSSPGSRVTTLGPTTALRTVPVLSALTHRTRTHDNGERGTGLCVRLDQEDHAPTVVVTAHHADGDLEWECQRTLLRSAL